MSRNPSPAQTGITAVLMAATGLLITYYSPALVPGLALSAIANTLLVIAVAKVFRLDPGTLAAASVLALLNCATKTVAATASFILWVLTEATTAVVRAANVRKPDYIRAA